MAASMRFQSLVAVAWLLALAVPSCSYDFDAPFENGSQPLVPDGSPDGALDAAADSAKDADADAAAHDSSEADAHATIDADSAADDGSPEADANGDAFETGSDADVADALDGDAGDAAPDGQIVEDCTNNIDDDEDGDVDCADSDCSPGYQCVKSTTVFARARPAGLPMSECPSGLTAARWWGEPQGGPALCSCGCMAPSGGQCEITEASAYMTPDCSHASMLFDPACTALVPDSSVRASAALLSPGSCQRSAAVVSKPAVTWPLAYDVCEPQAGGGGCGFGQVCAPVPADMVECRWSQIPMASCFGTTYTHRHPFSKTQASRDDRTCSSQGCVCGQPSGRSCQIEVALSDEEDCSLAYESYVYDNNECLYVPDSLQTYVAMTGRPAGGSCTPTGTPTPTGTVNLANEMTLCCVSSLEL